MDPKNALLTIFDTACRATLVSKDNGRESGLTAGDHADLKRAAEVIAKALSEGAETQKTLGELKDELAKVRAELDQAKAQSDASKTPKQKQDDYSQKCMAMQGVG